MRELGLNSLWLALGRVGAQALGVLLSVLLARRLGEAGFGQYAWLAALVAIGNAATTFGTDTLIIRELARAGASAPGGELLLRFSNAPVARDDRTTPALLGAAVWLQLALSVLWLGAVFVLAGPGLPLAFSLMLLPLAIYTPFSAALRAHERMDRFTWLNLFVAALSVLAAWLFVHSRNDLPTLAWALFAAQASGALLAAWLCARTVPRFAVSWRWDGIVLAAVVRAALPFALLMAAAMIYQRLGVLAITALAGEVTTGLYSAAARIVEGFKLGHYAALGALLPLAARSPRIPTLRVGWILGTASIVLGIAAFYFVTPLIELLFGARYRPASDALQVMVWALLPYSLSAYLSVQFVARNMEYRLLLGTLIALGVAAVLHVWLIALWGLNGAGWAMVLSECALAMVLFLLSGKTPYRGVSTNPSL
jgi:O-antigen/teichoic acid export membrane protein